MATKTIRTILALDGEQEFRNKLKQINSNLGVMRTNLKYLSDEYDRNGGKTKTLREKKSQLQESITQLRDKMTVLNQAVDKSKKAYDDAVGSYEKAVAEHGKESAEAHKAATAVSKAEATYNSFRTQLINTENELKKNEKELKEVSKQTSVLRSGIHAVTTGLKGMAKVSATVTFKGMKESLKGVGEMAKLSAEGLAAYTTAAAASAAGIAKYSVGVGMSFEEGMSGVEAIANATDEEMDALTERAKELGSSTKFTATEVSQGFNYMAMAGWEAEDMLKGIDGVINLAAASGEDLGLVSDMVTDSLTAFKMEAGDAGKYADILAQASSNANTNVAMMGETFQYCAPIAGAMGYKVDDLAVAVGLMANAGIKGSMAGTSLRSVITNLAAPTDAAEAAMKNLGISLTNEDGSMKSFEETVQQLRNGFQGLSEEEKAAAAKAIAGKPGMSGLLALVNASDQDYQSLRDSINDSAGAAERMAQIKLDNLAGDITILKSATEGLGLSIYDTFSVNLRDGVQELTDFVNQIHSAVDNGQNLVVVFRNIGTQIRKQLPSLFENAGPKIKLFLDGFNEVIIQVVDIVAESLPEITENILPVLTSSFTNLMKRVIYRLPELTKNVAEAATELFSGLFTGLKQASDILITELPDILNNIFGDPEAIAGFFDMGLSILVNLVKGITDNIDIVTTSLTTLLPSMIRSFAEQIPTLITSAIDIIGSLISNIDITELINVALKVLEKIAEGISDNAEKIAEIVPELVEKLLVGIFANADTLLIVAAKILGALAEALIKSVASLVDRLPEIFDQVIDAILDIDWIQVGKDIMDAIFFGMFSGTKKKDIKEAFAAAELPSIEAKAGADTLNRYDFDDLKSMYKGDPLSPSVNVQFGDVTITDPNTDINEFMEQVADAARQKQAAMGNWYRGR